MDNTVWITLLVCFSILDTAILVPWAISRRSAHRRAEEQRHGDDSAE